MIYVFTGSDQKKKLEARDALIQKNPSREVFFVNDINFDRQNFQNYLSGGDLFAKKYLVALDSLVASDVGEDVLDKVASMAESETIFIILESALLKSPTDMLKKHAESFQTFDLPKGVESKFNIFSVTDAFGARDKKNTWVLMQKGIREGVSAEEILNILIWQTKNLLFAQSGDIKTTGLSPFVYNKSKSYAKNFKPAELEDMSRELVSMFHESHLGLDLEPNLEKYLLKTL